jgi:predicted nuclease with TOPRIM domain
MGEGQPDRVEASITELRERIGRVEGRLEELSKRIDDINHSLSKRIDDLHKTVTAWFTVITILMVFLTAILPLILRYLHVYS